MPTHADHVEGASELDEVLADLRSDGWTEDMTAMEGGDVRCGRCGEASPAREFGSRSLRRVEGASDPGDMAAAVALVCPRCGAKGVLVTMFGPEMGIAEADVLAALEPPEETNSVRRP